MVAASVAPSASFAAFRKSFNPGPSTAKTNPGLVQNCPAPMVSDPANPLRAVVSGIVCAVSF
jgi:hypothetical protein